MNDDGFTKGARVFLGKSGRRERRERNSAFRPRSRIDTGSPSPTTGLIAQRGFRPAARSSRFRLEGIGRETAEGEPQSLSKARGSGADVPLPTNVQALKEHVPAPASTASDGKALGPDQKRARPGLFGGSPTSGFGLTDEFTAAGRHRLTRNTIGFLREPEPTSGFGPATGLTRPTSGLARRVRRTGSSEPFLT